MKRISNGPFAVRTRTKEEYSRAEAIMHKLGYRYSTTSTSSLTYQSNRAYLWATFGKDTVLAARSYDSSLDVYRARRWIMEKGYLAITLYKLIKVCQSIGLG